jgi:hypothetical protein
VNKRSSIVSAVIVSGSGYRAFSRESLGAESGVKVAEEDTDSSFSEVFEGVGDSARAVDPAELRFRDRIFCVMRVWEKGLACEDNGFEKSSTVFFIAVAISFREVYGKQTLRTQLFLSSDILQGEHCEASLTLHFLSLIPQLHPYRPEDPFLLNLFGPKTERPLHIFPINLHAGLFDSA